VKHSDEIKQQRIKLAVIGLGVMGSFHLENIVKTKNVKLTAVCDARPSVAEEKAKQYGVKAFYSHQELLQWGKAQNSLEAILIATPHYDHKWVAIDAFTMGFHVLTEKPVGAHVNDVIKMIEAWKGAKEKNPKLVFATMFQQRTLGQWRKIKEILETGELGKLIRATWIVTDCFRPQYYYDHGDWRGTWRGEGGGVLLNQCPHQLDLFQWFFGLPDRIRGFVSIGKYHRIEVEDEVTAYYEYNNGLIGHFITSTGEAPGTNRLEIVGELGKLTFENDKLTLWKNKISALEYIKTAKERFPQIESKKITLQYDKSEVSPHKRVIENFAEAILKGIDPIAPAIEGLNSISMSNAIILSHFQGKTVRLPLDGDAYESLLNQLIEKSN